MRVISQKGRKVVADIPYDNVAISQSMVEPNKIIAWDVTAGEDYIIYMAEYSTSEKAEKAMQKLHDKYSYVLRIEHGLEAYYSGESFVFRFPQDDEL